MQSNSDIESCWNDAASTGKVCFLSVSNTGALIRMTEDVRARQLEHARKKQENQETDLYSVWLRALCARFVTIDRPKIESFNEI